MIEPGNLLARLGIEWRPRGKRLVALCPSPDHDDHKPSWAAWSDERGRFRHRCLSCGFGGGPANLVMAVLKCDRRAAHDFLDSSESAGPPPPPGIRVEVREPARKTVDVPDEVWLEELEKWPAPARRYLEKRRVTERERQRWGMGYAVDGQLCGRVWFPVYDRGLGLVAWTARAFDGDDLKYLSSPAPAIHTLLGEHLWPSHRGLGATCVVVEGPFDAVAVDAACGTPVAALRGSSTGARTVNPGQAAKLARFPNLVIATDPDEAGEGAADLIRGLARWCLIRQARLHGDDCAALYEQGGPGALAGALGLPVRASMEDRSSMDGWG